MGVGWGVRLLWALGAGCVPLLASSEVAVRVNPNPNPNPKKP